MWKRIKAFFRWDLEAVCEMSKGKIDYHDYPDCLCGQPEHFIEHQCARCGKQFTI